MTTDVDATAATVDTEMTPDDAAENGATMQQMHQKLSIPYEKYKCLTDILVAHIREREELTENEGEYSESDDDDVNVSV
jgi:hypothetical protein